MANTKHLIQKIAADPLLLHSIHPREFEEVIAELLASFGWQVSVTPTTRDGGYDILAVSKDQSGLESTWVVECKRYRPGKNVGVEVVRSIYGVKSYMAASNALIVTTSGFSKGATSFVAPRYDLQLAGYEKVVEWIKQYVPAAEDESYLPRRLFYSCFISYSSKDQLFAERLHADLQKKGVRCWFAPEDLKIGDRFRDRIDESIQLHDKLLVVLSENSVSSQWVNDEVETAIERERREGHTVLFPIKIDDAVTESEQAWAAAIRRTRHIGDFTRWKDHDSYQRAFERLLRDLKAEEGARATAATTEGESTDGQFISEFEEIKANILFSTLAHVIGAELKRLKTFLHKHSFLLNRKDISDFYVNWIAPFEIHLEFGASLDLKQAQYEQMKEQLANIDLRSATP